MKNMKKPLLVSLSLVLIAALAIGMTLAYLTDTDEAVNVMTMGNVSIVQNEQERDGNGNLVDFTQAKPLLPAVYAGEAPNASIPWDTAANWAVANNEAWKTVDKTSINVQDKFVTVTNTGKTDAYVRTIIAYEGDVINGTDIHVIQNSVTSSNSDVAGEFAATDYIENVIINNVRYDIIVYTYKNELAPKATTIPSLKQVYMDKGCDNDDVAKYGDTYEILVVSQAVQADGFSDAVTALNDAFGVISASNHPWQDGSGVVTVTNDAELDAAIKDGAKTIILEANTYTLPTVSGDVTLIGTSKDVIFDCTTDTGSNSKNVKFVNVTIQGVNKDYTGMKHTTSVTYENCLIKDSLTLYANDVVFTNCEFNLTGRYIWTYGANNVLFDNCTFNNADSRSILVFQDGDKVISNVTVKDCTFTAEAKGYTGAGDWTAAIEIDTSLSPASVVVENCVVDGNYNGVIRVKAGTPTVSENGNQKVDIMIATAEDMFNFAKDVNVNKNSYSGKTVMLTADIDLNNELWTPIGQTGATQFLGTFDGNGYTISNLNIDMSDKTDAYSSSGLFGWLNRGTVKNVTVDTATVKGNHNVGVIAGYMETSGCTISGCNVVNATITATHVNGDQCGDKVGVIVGHAGNSGVVVKNCTAKDSTVTAGRDAGQIVGAAKTANVTGCTATNVTVSADGTCPKEANITNDIIGRIL